jgi:hypothetical protein
LAATFTVTALGISIVSIARMVFILSFFFSDDLPATGEHNGGRWDATQVMSGMG